VNWTEKEWALWGKWLLFLWGLVALASAFSEGQGAFHLTVRGWLGLLGALSLYTSIKNLAT